MSAPHFSFSSDYTEGYPLRKDFPLQGKGWRDTFEFLNEKV